jgi:hypothetical protein
MNWIRALSVFVLCPWLIALGPASATGQVLEQTFSENLAEFSISTPNERWTFAPRSITPGTLRATLRFQTPVDQFIPNVTVRVMPVYNPQTQLKDVVEEDLKAMPAEVEILSQEPMKHGSWEGFEIQMRDPKAQVRFLQWIFLAKGKNFMITGVAKESAWSRLEGDIKKILNSFQIR